MLTIPKEPLQIGAKQTGRSNRKEEVNVKRDLEKEIIIPEPPSEYDRFAELIDIKSQYYNRVNPENMQTYLDESMEELFFSYIDKSGENIDKEYIVNLKKDIKPIIKNHKEHFNSDRPNELAEKHDFPFEYDYLESAQTRSYPSGHTAQAFYVALNLSDKFPHLKDGLIAIAQMVADSRIDRGVHFFSDNLGGVLLAEKFFKIKKDYIDFSKRKASYNNLSVLQKWLKESGFKKESDKVFELKKIASEGVFPLSTDSKRMGIESDYVLEAQERLLELGYHMDAGADGKFGPQTVTAVKEFQERNNLAQTGELSEDQYNLLLSQDAEKAEEKRVIVALGDSITAGGYARDLQSIVPGSRTFTFGYGGRQTGFIKRKLDLALKKNPQDIIILAGVNDIASGKDLSHITTNLKEMYDRSIDAGVRVVAVKILCWHGRKSSEDKEGKKRQMTWDVNSWIEGYINGLPSTEDGRRHLVIEPNELCSGDIKKYEMSDKYTNDRIHPNSDGKKMLAQIIADQAFQSQENMEPSLEAGYYANQPGGSNDEDSLVVIDQVIYS